MTSNVEWYPTVMETRTSKSAFVIGGSGERIESYLNTLIHNRHELDNNRKRTTRKQGVRENKVIHVPPLNVTTLNSVSEDKRYLEMSARYWRNLRVPKVSGPLLHARYQWDYWKTVQLHGSTKLPGSFNPAFSTTVRSSHDLLVTINSFPLRLVKYSIVKRDFQ